MDAIKLFHGEVSSDLLMKEKQFDGLRTKLLKGAADFYGRLEGLLKGQADHESRVALAKAYSKLAFLTYNIGSREGALSAHRKALASYRSLAAEPGAGDEEQFALFVALINIGAFQAYNGDVAGALASSEEAVGIIGKLVDAHPENEKYTSSRRTIQINIGSDYAQMGDLRRALAAYRASADEKVVAANPGDTSGLIGLSGERARRHRRCPASDRRCAGGSRGFQEECGDEPGICKHLSSERRRR